MFRKKKETQELLKTSRRSLRHAEDKIKELTKENRKLRKFVINTAMIIYYKGQGTIVDKYDKIKMLVDDYQSNN